MEEVLWHYFESTGQIGAYLFYKEFHEVRGQRIIYSKGHQPISTPEGRQNICDIGPLKPRQENPNQS